LPIHVRLRRDIAQPEIERPADSVSDHGPRANRRPQQPQPHREEVEFTGMFFGKAAVHQMGSETGTALVSRPLEFPYQREWKSSQCCDCQIAKAVAGKVGSGLFSQQWLKQLAHTEASPKGSRDVIVVPMRKCVNETTATHLVVKPGAPADDIPKDGVKVRDDQPSVRLDDAGKLGQHGVQVLDVLQGQRTDHGDHHGVTDGE
jgi:hypothetical protein